MAVRHTAHPETCGEARDVSMTQTVLPDFPFDSVALRPTLLDSVVVNNTEEKRTVLCFCGETIKRSIVPHMKSCHEVEWKAWVKTFVDLRGHGLPLKRIMNLFCAGNDVLLFSWTVIDRAIRSAVESEETEYYPPPIQKVRIWEPPDFQLETTTIWDFPIRGNWAVHIGDYRGNWPPQLVRNILLKYTKPGDLVLDAFMGGGTTLIEAWLLNRHSIGIDVSRLAYQTSLARLESMEELSKQDSRTNIEPKYKPRIILGDSTFTKNRTTYDTIKPNSVNLLCVHPPYLDALIYTDNHPEDLSQVRDPVQFLKRITAFAEGCAYYLASENVCAVLIGDVRRHGQIIPLGARTLGAFLSAGFHLEDIIVKTQHRDRSSEFYFSSRHGYLLAHEYLYLFRWPSQEKTETC